MGDDSRPVPHHGTDEDNDVTDGETGEVIKRTDLANQADTDRAVVHFQLKDGIELKSESSPGSPQNKAQTTLYLAVAVAAITLVATWIGIPAAAALITGTGVTIALYLLIHFTSGQRKRE